MQPFTEAPLFDIGANLAHESFADDLGAVLQRAATAGVRRIAITGSDLQSSRFAVDKVRQDPALFCATAGLHPHWAAKMDADTEAQLQHLAGLPEVAAVGETGLDYFRDLSPRRQQIACCEKQVHMACALNKPVFLHEREAHADLLPLVREVRDRLPAAVLHCFTGSPDQLADWLDLDVYIGITGWICDERRGRHLQSLVADIPSDRLLLETDAPYLLPRDLPPEQRPPAGLRRNEPQYLAHICRAVAHHRGESAKDLAAAVWRNSLTFFNLTEDSV